MTNTSDSFGSRLRKLITDRGWKFSFAADKAGVSLSHLNKIMNDDTQPSLKMINTICEKLDFKKSDLLGETPNRVLDQKVGDMTAPEFLENVWGIKSNADPNAVRLISIAHRLPPNILASLVQVAETLLATTENESLGQTGSTKPKQA